MIVVKAEFRNFRIFHCLNNGTPRVVKMFAVPEFAVRGFFQKFRVPPDNLFRRQVPESEFTYPRGVNDGSVLRQVVEARTCGGMLTESRNIGYAVCGCVCFRDNRVYDGGFPHAGLTYENGRFTFDYFPEAVNAFSGSSAYPQRFIAYFSVGLQNDVGFLSFLRSEQIALVYNDDGFYAAVNAGDICQ